jgi:hypothetical protein
MSILHDAFSRDAHLDQHLDALRRDFDAQPRRRRAWMQRPAAQSPGRTGEGAQCLGLTLAATLPGQGRSRVGA